jgi:hypothetical protein
MTVAAAVTQYRDEFIASFEDRMSVLRSTCVTEAIVKGLSAVFLVSGSNNDTADTRGVDGLIPANQPTNTQSTVTLQEFHRLERMTDFNIFASQGDQRRVMQMNCMSVINRKMDDQIIAQLDTATNDTGAAAVASLDLHIKARTILGNNYVDLTDENNLFALVSPAFDGYMMQVTEYASADYVEVKPFSGPARRFRRWGGFNWIVHPRLTGSIGANSANSGASEQCYYYNRNAMGHAMDSAGLDVRAGYDEEQAYSWARHSGHMNALLLQNSGVVQVLHNGSAYAAS